MLDLLDMILANVTTLTAGELWDDSATEDLPVGEQTKKTLDTYRGGLPPKDSDDESESRHPFLVARLLTGGEDVSLGRIKVRLLAGLHTHGGVDDGLVDVDRLLGLLLQIPKDRNFSPYTLEEGVTWCQGNQKDGLQPHPKYYLTVDLEFTRAPVMDNY